MKQILIILILLSLNSNAQSKVSLAIYQDLKFATIGDKERGYDAFTLDAVIRLKMQGVQNTYGYLIIFPEYEYADIKGIYKRYSANIGYTFNRLVLDNFEATISGGWGWIDRYGLSGYSFGSTAELAYKINDVIKVNGMLQGTERKDLKILWNDNAFRLSGFVGFEINLN